MSSIGSRFEEERKRVGIANPNQLARCLGIARATVYRIIVGKSVPGADILREYARYGADVAYIVTGTRVQTSDTNRDTVAISRECAKEAWRALHIRREDAKKACDQARDAGNSDAVDHWIYRIRDLTDALNEIDAAEAR